MNIKFFSWLFAAMVAIPVWPESLSAQSTNSAANAQDFRKHHPTRTLDNGRYVAADELQVTLTESFASSLSLDTNKQRRPVDLSRLLGLHRDIVKIEGGHTSARRWLSGDALPERVARTDGRIPRIARNFSVFLRPGADVEEVRNSLRRQPGVERVDFEDLISLDSIPNDPGYGSQWAPPITGLETAWDVPGRGHVRVAVVDSGVYMAHSEFQGRVVYQAAFGDLPDGNPPASGDDFDHGTHVAGIICANRNNLQGVAGYSGDIDLMVMNCARWDDTKNKWVIHKADSAINDAVANGAQIINCSFGFAADIEDEVEDAYDHSVLVVHAAGNDTNTIAGRWESVSVALLTVTATTTNGGTDVFDASYSNYGPGVDLAAPGSAIWSTVPGGYDYKWGTSMAAPQVSGAAALIMSMNPSLIGDESTRHLLIRMAQDKGPAGYDQQYGYGVLRLKQSTLQACRDATAFVSSASTFAEEGAHYDRPWHSLASALANVPNGSTLILNGGVNDVATYDYPAITITKPCTLSVIPDRPAIIGK